MGDCSYYIHKSLKKAKEYIKLNYNKLVYFKTLRMI